MPEEVGPRIGEMESRRESSSSGTTLGGLRGGEGVVLQFLDGGEGFVVRWRRLRAKWIRVGLLQFLRSRTAHRSRESVEGSVARRDLPFARYWANCAPNARLAQSRDSGFLRSMIRQRATERRGRLTVSIVSRGKNSKGKRSLFRNLTPLELVRVAHKRDDRVTEIPDLESTGEAQEQALLHLV